MFNAIIVDDEKKIINGLVSLFEDTSYNIKVQNTAFSGDEAIMKINSDTHIVFTDIKMPNTNGLELIEKIVDTYPKIKIIVISAFDDFEYVKLALKKGVSNYLLKPIDNMELKETIQNISIDIKNQTDSLFNNIDYHKNNLLNNWIYGTIQKVDFKEKSTLLELNYDFDYQCCIIFKLLNFTDKDKIFGMIENFENIIKDFYNANYRINITIFQSNSCNIVAIAGTNEIQLLETTVKESIINFTNIFKNKLEYDFFIVISKTVDYFWDMNTAYMLAQDLLPYSVFYETINYIFYSDYVDENSEETFIDDFSDLNLLLKQRDVNGAIKYIEDKITSIVFTKSLFVKKLRYFINRFIIQIMFVINTEFKKTNYLPSELKDLMSHFDKIYTLDEIKLLTENTIIATVKILEENENQKKPVVEYIISYINENYHNKELSLKIISDKFKMSTSYLGQLFILETDLSFSTYLNNVRIEKAKELLKDNYYKIYEISEIVGYSSASYFHRVFKKATDVSPADYTFLG